MRNVMEFNGNRFILLVFSTVFLELSTGSALTEKPSGLAEYFLFKATPTIFEVLPTTPSKNDYRISAGHGFDPNAVLTIATNLGAGYRNTQFFQSGYNTVLFHWDSRVELWGEA